MSWRGQTVVAVDTERPAARASSTTPRWFARTAGTGSACCSRPTCCAGSPRTEPQIETIDTWNAESNDHMIGVNEALGYRVMGRELEFQMSI